MRKNELKITDLFDISHSITCRLLADYTYPWEVLPHISEMIKTIGAILPEEEYNKTGKSIWIHKSVKIHPTVCISGSAIICEGAEIRQCAYIRGNAIIGSNTVVGNSTELKNVILFDRVQVPHYNYVGDSILGFGAHMGAGSITSNVRSDKKLVKIHASDGDIETDMKKVGAMIGDGVEVGCSSVLNPGVIIGKNTNIYPLSSVRGCVAANSIYKQDGAVVRKIEE